MQNRNTEQPATPPATPIGPLQDVKGLKGTLKAAFTRKSLWGFVKASFNRARENKWEILGSALVSGGIKWAAIACTASAATSAIGVMSAAATAGAASALVRHAIKISLAKKGVERDALRISNKELLKKAAFGATFGAAGSAFGMGAVSAYEHFANQCFNRFSGLKDMFITAHKTDALTALGGHVSKPAVGLLQTTPPIAEMAASAPAPAGVPDVTTIAPAAPGVAATITPAPSVPATPLDAIKEYAANNNVSAKLKGALLRAESPSAHVRAQALDDIAVYAPKSLQLQSYELLKQSAGMGNLKAKADLITMEFYGSKTLGIKADPEAAIDKMVALSKHSKFAAKMVDQWVGTPSGPAVATPLEHVVIPSGTTHVTTVDLTDTPPIVPSTEPSVAAPAVTESAAPDCVVAVDPKNVENLIMSCDVNAADIGLNVGDEIFVKRPAAAWVLNPR